MTTQDFEWIRTSLTALLPVLVVAGWFLVNHQNNKRESRKEVRQLVDRSLRLVVEIVETTTALHTAETSDPTARNTVEWRLIFSLKSLSAYLGMLSNSGMIVTPCQQACIRLKNTITGEDFQTTSWKPWEASDKRWQALLTLSNELSESLDRQYFECVKTEVW